jgi:ABC-type uncharacterized transport system substrate-binding protein
MLLPLALPSQAHCKTDPSLHNGKKWIIAYYEGGPYTDYVDTMRTFVSGLMSLGWIPETHVPERSGDVAKPYWDFLTACGSPYLSFESRHCYSAGWDPTERERCRLELMDKLQSGAVDLVIAMGTWAGQDLANHGHSVPTIVMSTSNPVEAGIIKSEEDPGYPHVTARVDKDRYLRQIRMFHRIVGFDNLGVAFENTEDGRIYSAMKEVYRVSQERGFSVTTCELIDTTEDLAVSDRSCLDCFRRLAGSVDAVYVTALNCADRKIREISRILAEADVPSFSLVGSKWVRQGIMLSISSDSGYDALGRYNAEKFARILNGASPGSLVQVFKDPLEIAVNRRTAREIGFDIPSSILRIAQEIYE